MGYPPRTPSQQNDLTQARSLKPHWFPVLLRLSGDPVAKHLQRRVVGFALGIDEVVGLIAQMLVGRRLDQHAALQFVFDKQARDEGDPNTVNRCFGEHRKQFESRTRHISFDLHVVRSKPVTPCIWTRALLQERVAPPVRRCEPGAWCKQFWAAYGDQPFAHQEGAFRSWPYS